MAMAELYTGTATISTTEYSLVSSSTTLSSDTTDGVFQVFIDLNAMVAADQYEIKIKEKTVSGGTQRLIYSSYPTGIQTSLFVSPSLILMHGWDVTVKRLAGSDKSIVWSIRQVA